MVSGRDYGANPVLGPPDFHADVEVFLADAYGIGRWYIFDPSGTAIPMGFVRFATGRDAADIAFATISAGSMRRNPSSIFRLSLTARGNWCCRSMRATPYLLTDSEYSISRV